MIIARDNAVDNKNRVLETYPGKWECPEPIFEYQTTTNTQTELAESKQLAGFDCSWQNLFLSVADWVALQKSVNKRLNSIVVPVYQMASRVLGIEAKKNILLPIPYYRIILLSQKNNRDLGRSRGGDG